MNKLLISMTLLCAGTASVSGSILLQDNFDSYISGALAGQGGWTTSAGNASDFTISGGKLLISGSDGTGILQSPGFTSSTEAYYGFDLTVTTVNTAGQRPSFARFGTNRSISNIRDWNSGTEFDIANNGGAQIPFDGTTLRLVAHYVSGVSQTWWVGATIDETSPYYTTSAGGGGQSFMQFLAPASGIFAAEIDNLVVSTTWAEAAAGAAIPEPSAYALGFGLLGLALVMVRRRMRN